MSDPLKDVDATIGADENVDVAFWRKEIHLAIQREKKYQGQAERVTKLYEGDKRDDNSFNILYSNTNILLPACYNQLPRPFVDRRFKDADPLGKLSAQALERVLSALEDSGDAEYEPFDSLLEQAVLGALVPGRGVTRFRYDAKFEGAKASVEYEEGEDSDTGEDTGADGTGPTTEAGPGREVLEVPGDEKVTYETICGDDVDYNHFLMGYARRWKNTPWIAYYHEMEKEDAIASFGKEKADLLIYSPRKAMPDGWKRSSQKEEDGGEEGAQRGSRPSAAVYEIWHKEKKEVVFYSPTCKAKLIDTIDDPFGLSGFYPQPEPLYFVRKRSRQTPTPLYIFYEEQAKELNRLTQRINRILHALKVRGVYDGSIGKLKDLLNSDDNTMLPATNVATMREGNTLDNSIWFMPLDMLIKVLQQLMPAREIIKNTIYEITGISDIMRGDTQASETATAQNIKNTYGTLRLNQFRKKVQLYARDCLRIMGELASLHFSLDTFAQMTDLDFALPADIKKAQKTIQALNERMMQMQQQAMAQQRLQQMAPPAGPSAVQPPPGIPGTAPPTQAPAGPPQQPPGPPQPPAPPQVQPTPQMQQAMQQAQAVLAKPPWEQVVGLLKNDLQRYYRIDIETNSTIASDTAEDKQNITEALQVIGEFIQGMQPLAETGLLPMAAVKAMLMSVVRRFQFGREVEDALNQLPDQLPNTGGAQAGKQAEMQAKQAQAQLDMQLAQLKGQQAQRDDQYAQQEFGFKMARMQREDQLHQQNAQLKMAQIAAKMQEINMQTHATQVEAQADVQGAALGLQKDKIGLQMQKEKAAAAKRKPNGN